MSKINFNDTIKGISMNQIKQQQYFPVDTKVILVSSQAQRSLRNDIVSISDYGVVKWYIID